MASALEARTKFPQLVIGDEKRVRFVVVHGLELVERPATLPLEDIEWFKRLTGRHEAAISPRDYNFFSPRVKHRRPQHSLSNVPVLPPYSTVDANSGLPLPAPLRGGPQFPVPDSGSMATRSPPLQAQQQQSQQQQAHQQHQSHSAGHLLAPQHASHGQHTPTHASHSVHGPLTSPHAPHTQHTPHTPPHIQSPLMHSGGNSMMLVGMPPNTPAKYCDECGAQYLRETSKFCSECGAKRLGT
jgi:hypothetical protein